MSANDKPINEDEDETVKLIHRVISVLEEEGYSVTGCSWCSTRQPARPAKCRLCGRICYPKDQKNN